MCTSRLTPVTTMTSSIERSSAITPTLPAKVGVKASQSVCQGTRVSPVWREK